MAITRTRSTKPQAPQTPTITDEQYQELLAIRLAAMKGFDAGTVDAETKNKARAAVRKARTVRKAEAAVITTWNAFQAEQEAAKAKAAEEKKAARKPRTRKAAAAPAPELVSEDESDTDRQMEAEVAETE